ncbi:hypothetical protein L596_006809 [Steinernema carpocapsae]|uniref:Uncharacterized protein n=1 Tax=Steinernema carpocapsae TaxID=34508 RepID=A0A4U5P817_STECR|nr:hypothetical protein L596_006809 [Steinernema carpocapsae]
MNSANRLVGGSPSASSLSNSSSNLGDTPKSRRSKIRGRAERRRTVLFGNEPISPQRTPTTLPTKTSRSPMTPLLDDAPYMPEPNTPLVNYSIMSISSNISLRDYHRPDVTPYQGIPTTLEISSIGSTGIMSGNSAVSTMKRVPEPPYPKSDSLDDMETCLGETLLKLNEKTGLAAAYFQCLEEMKSNEKTFEGEAASQVICKKYRSLLKEIKREVDEFKVLASFIDDDCGVGSK